jgi:PHD/YefM family antitoxin component YafN of YafNO toxin-antitoxin module
MTRTIVLKESAAPCQVLADQDLDREPIILERDGKPVAVIISIEMYRAVEQALRVVTLPAASKPGMISFEQGRMDLQRMLPDLLKTHANQFVAVLDGKVVDADADKVALAHRVYERFGYRPIYMDQALPQPRVVRLPSPRMVRQA